VHVVPRKRRSRLLVDKGRPIARLPAKHPTRRGLGVSQSCTARPVTGPGARPNEREDADFP